MTGFMGIPCMYTASDSTIDGTVVDVGEGVSKYTASDATVDVVLGGVLVVEEQEGGDVLLEQPEHENPEQVQAPCNGIDVEPTKGLPKEEHVIVCNSKPLFIVMSK